MCPDCAIHSFHYMENCIEAPCFAICAICSGLFYFKIIRTLRSGRQSSRTNTVTKTFVVLWISWILCVLPYIIMDFYTSTLMVEYQSWLSVRHTDPANFFDKLAIITFGVKRNGEKYMLWNKTTQMASAFYSAFMSLKHSYGFINSFLMIVLLRPFQQPVQSVINKIKINLR